MATPKFALSMAVAAAGLMLSVPASADVRTMEVRTGDLDLSQPAAQELLADRIDRAVRRVCRSNDQRNLEERRDAAQCEANARADAEAKMMRKIAEATGKKQPKLASD